jgi:hypothetical protein
MINSGENLADLSSTASTVRLTQGPSLWAGTTMETAGVGLATLTGIQGGAALIAKPAAGG